MSKAFQKVYSDIERALGQHNDQIPRKSEETENKIQILLDNLVENTWRYSFNKSNVKRIYILFSVLTLLNHDVMPKIKRTSNKIL